LDPPRRLISNRFWQETSSSQDLVLREDDDVNSAGTVWVSGACSVPVSNCQDVALVRETLQFLCGPF
jgi:hypothetical protein